MKPSVQIVAFYALNDRFNASYSYVSSYDWDMDWNDAVLMSLSDEVWQNQCLHRLDIRKAEASGFRAAVLG